MKQIERLKKEAIEYRTKGLDSEDIAREMNLSRETVDWLLSRTIKEEPPVDVKIGWRSIGVYPNRIAMISSIMADIVFEEMEKGDWTPDIAVGIAHNGIAFATFLANELGIEFAIYRPGKQGSTGSLGANYAGVDGKKIVIVDDVLGTGTTMRGTINTLRGYGGKPVLGILLVNKTEVNEIDGMPIRALIRARAIAVKR